MGSGGNAAVNGTFLVAGVPDLTHIVLYMPYAGIAATMGGTISVGSGPWTLALTNDCGSGTWPSCQPGNHFLAQNDNGDTESFDPHACAVSGGMLQLNLRTSNVYVPPAEMRTSSSWNSSTCHVQTWPGNQFGFAFGQSEELYMDSYAQFPTSGDATLWALATSNIWNEGPEVDWPECFGGGGGTCDDRSFPGNRSNGSARPGTTAFMQFGVDISASSISYFQNGTQINHESNPAPGTVWYPVIDVASDTSGGTVTNGAMLVQYIRIYKKVTSGACYTTIPPPSTIPHLGSC